MSNLVDSLITEYIARDLSTPTVERMARANEQLGHSIDRAARASERQEAASRRSASAHSMTMGAVQRLIGLTAALEIAQRGLDFVGSAQRAASEYASLEARLTALVGTHEAASRKLKMAELVAAPSPFTTKQLADSAVLLEAMGVNSERVLPSLGRLGAAMGATGESMEMFTRAFGELANGKMIESDVRAAMGVTLADFKAQGIDFDGQGKLLSSAESTMQALENIVNQRFGNIYEQMANTPEAKRASLEDAGERAMRIIGAGMLRTQAPLVDALTKSLNAAVDSGVLGEVTDKLSGVFMKALGGSDFADPLMKTMATALAVISNIPDAAGRAFRFVNDLFSTVFKNLHTAGTFAYNVLKSIWGSLGGPVEPTKIGGGAGDVRAYERDNPYKLRVIMGSMDGGLGELGGLLKTIFTRPDEGKLFRQGAQTLFGDGIGAGGGLFPNLPALPTFKSLPSASDYFGGFDITEGSDRFYKMMLAASKKTATIPDTSGMSFFSRQPAGEDEDALGAIAKSTERTAKNTERLDIGKLLFGGGDRAALGVSMADLSSRGSAISRGMGRTGFGSYGLGSHPQPRLVLPTSSGEEEGFVNAVLRKNLPGILQSLGLEVVVG